MNSSSSPSTAARSQSGLSYPPPPSAGPPARLPTAMTNLSATHSSLPRLLSLSAAFCAEAIWKCPSPSAVQEEWLPHLHLALLRDRPDSYDPSEIFLALQGVVLRWGSSLMATTAVAATSSRSLARPDPGTFSSSSVAAVTTPSLSARPYQHAGHLPPSSPSSSSATATTAEVSRDSAAAPAAMIATSVEGTSQGGGDTSDLGSFEISPGAAIFPSSLPSKSLELVALLARQCVGPAWWRQLRQRHEQRQQLSLGVAPAAVSTTPASTSGRPETTARATEAAVTTAESSTSLESAESTTTSDSVPMTTPKEVVVVQTVRPEALPTIIAATAATVTAADVNHHHHHPPPPPEDPPAANRSPRSCSPMTPPPSALRSSLPTTHRSLPFRHIPEVLPAAMIRFAASFVPPRLESLTLGTTPNTDNEEDTMINIIMAQMTLVNVLLCPPTLWASPLGRQHSPTDPPEKNETGDPPDTAEDEEDMYWAPGSSSYPSHHHQLGWSVPGVQEPLQDMVQLWLNVVVKKLHARPPNTPWGDVVPEEPHGEEGTLHQDNSHSRLERPHRENMDLEFMLKVIGLCSDLFSAGWCPRMLTCQQLVVSLTTVASLASTSAGHQYPSSLSEPPSLYTAMVSEAVMALSTLASRGLIPVAVMDTWIPTIIQLRWVFEDVLAKIKASGITIAHGHAPDRDLSYWQSFVEDLDELVWLLLAQERSATATLDALFSVFTGGVPPATSDHPEVQSSPPLEKRDRAYAIKLICVSLWGQPPDIHDIPLLRVFWMMTIQTISKVLSSSHIRNDDDRIFVNVTIGSLTLVLEKAIRCGSGNMNLSEWDELILCIEVGIIPYLSSANGGDGYNEGAQSFFVILARFLDSCARFEQIPFADYDTQEKIYKLCLNQVLPRLVPTMGNRLGAAIFACWTRFAFSPHKLLGWKDAASEILSYAFAETSGGVSVHSPSLQLQVLESLTCDHDSSGRACDVTELGQDCFMSLLIMTQHFREQHRDLVYTCFLPTIRRILFPTASRSSSGELQGAPRPPIDQSALSPIAENAASFLQRVAASSPNSESDRLTEYAIDLMGRLFRSLSGERSLRKLLVEMLLSVAVGDQTFEEGLRKGRVGTASPLFIRLMATVELGNCLEEIFEALSHARDVAPIIVQALCCVFDSFSHLEDVTTGVAIAAVAMDPLSRIRVALDRNIAFRKRYKVPIHYKESILMFVKEMSMVDCWKRSAIAEKRGCPFLSIDQIGLHTTQIQIEPIVNSIISFLQEPKLIGHGYASQIHTFVTMACLDMLRSLFLVNAMPPFHLEIASKAFTCSSGAALIEDRASFAAAVQWTQNILTLTRIERGENEKMDGIGQIPPLFDAIKFLLDSMNFYSEDTCVAACSALSSMLPSMVELARRGRAKGALDVVHRKLIAAMDADKARQSNKIRGEPYSLPSLDLIHDFLILDKGLAIPRDLVVAAASLCIEEISDTNASILGTNSKHVALRCLSGLIDRMDVDLIEDVISKCKTIAGGRTEDIFLQRVTTELAQQRSLVVEREFSPSVCRSCHEELCLEHDSFTQGMLDSTSRSYGAWLFPSNDVLLVCRIWEAPKSYIPSIELIVRTVSSRSRIQFQLPMLKSRNVSFEQARGNALSDRLYESMEKNGGSSSVLKRARDLTSRFERLIPQQDSAPSTDNIAENQSEKEKPPEVYFSKIMNYLDNMLQRPSSDEKSDLGMVGHEVTQLLRSVGLQLEKSGPPRKLCQNKMLDISISILDRTPVLNTHKVALIYDTSALHNKNGADLESKLLGATNCSPSFSRFASCLGRMVPTCELKYFSGGLDTTHYETDGKYALVWLDDDESKSMASRTAIVFHVPNLMPQGLMQRKRHIGNDSVLIFYSDQGSEFLVDLEIGHEEYQSAILGAFGFVAIFVTPLAGKLTRVSLRFRKSLLEPFQQKLRHLVGDHVLAEEDAAAYIRNLAVRADLICRLTLDSVEPPSNCIRRYELLREMQRYMVE